jgi:UDP-galactopyranose mutase
MSTHYDLLIVGAGPTGCVVARQAAEAGMKVLVIDRRTHIAGNCYDQTNDAGVLTHQYGPHYFRTNDKPLIDWLSRFTEWIPGNYRVVSYSDGTYYPFPINLTTLEMISGRDLTPYQAQQYLDGVVVPCRDIQNARQYVESRVGTAIYQQFYRDYSTKQWGMDPSHLAASVCGRIPIRLDRDDRYVDHQYQQMPAAGYTAMFNRMLNHPLITVQLSTNYDRVRHQGQTVYTGPVDEYFGYQFGRLPWRSLSFRTCTFEREFRQPCVQVNYPDLQHTYTRTVEIKHVTGQKCPVTTIVYEYPEPKGEPYYPVPCPESAALYSRYKELADREAGVLFCGRLAQYRYVDMDQVMLSALECARTVTVPR